MGEILRPTRKPNCKGTRIGICRQCGFLRVVVWNSTRCLRCTREAKRVKKSRERLKRSLPYYLKTESANN